jgi:hypothetical protein
MNVLILTTMVSFSHHAGDEWQRNLVRQLHLHGVSAEMIRIPVTPDSAERIVDEMMICRSLQLLNVDRVIALRFPAYLVPHPDKVCWLTDYWEEVEGAMECGGLRIPNTPRGKDIARIIGHSDNECLGRARSLFAGTPSIRDRLKARNGLDAEILTLPSPSSDAESTWGAAIKRILA